MDLDGPQLLAKVLQPSELEQIPAGIQQKLRSYIDGLISEYCKEKTAGTLLNDYEEMTEDLQNQVQDYKEKLKNYEQNVNELRSQLDQVTQERTQMIEKANKHELEVVNLRKEKNEVVEERDSLLKMIERQNSDMERMKQDLQSFHQQLNAALTAKCEALARLDEVESKEVAIQLKERRMEQEHSLMQNEIDLLKADLNRNITEMQNIRRESTVQTLHLQTQLTEKLEELKIVQSQNQQYKKSIEDLNESQRKYNEKILQQKEESDKLIDTYKKELDMKAKLIENYKGSSEDNDSEMNELMCAVSELKRMLTEATDAYGALETQKREESLKYEQLIGEKTKQIEDFKKELLYANDLLKEVQQESVESAISKLAPTAAVANRLIRTDMSLTELYSLYARTCEDLETQKKENARLNLQIKAILNEFSERAPLIEKQEIEYKKLVEANSMLSQQRDELIAKKRQTDAVLGEIELKVNHLGRENARLKRLRDDMNRQMVCMLNEVEHLRIGIEPNNTSAVGSMSTSDEVISKKLVTYTSLDELLQHNQKLLMLVRDLTQQVEESEQQKREFNEAAYKEKLESYSKKVQNMQEVLNQKSEALTGLVAKCERYKKMYFEIQKSLGGKQDNISQLDDSMAVDEVENAPKKSDCNASTPSQNENYSNTELRIRSLEQQLHDANEKCKSLKEQYEYYKTEKQNNDKLFQDQFDSMRNEVRELTSTNCKVMNALEFHKEQGILLQKNISTYKQQIEALEQRTKNYETTIIKHEQTVRLLKDEIMSVQRKYATAEAETSHLRHENRILKDGVSRLQAEKEGFHREHQSQALLLNNLELIKSNLERSETEGRQRLENRLDDAMRELSAQRRHFQEEEDRFRETVNEFKRQTETAKKQMEDEKQQANKLRTELIAVRGELTAKVQQIDELSKKLQSSLTPSQNDNPIAAANKKARDFENKFEEAKMEIASLTNELAKAREHGEQFYKMSQSAESEVRKMHEMHTQYIKNAEEKIEMLKKSEAALKNKVSDLEADIMLANVTERSKDTNQTGQIKNSQEELKNALLKLSEANATIRTLRTENSSLSESLSMVEKKYANEMVLHSADIEQLCSLKAELTKVQDQIKDLTSGRDTAQAAYEELKRTQDESRQLLQNEKEEFEKRIEDLNALNGTLHDQIEALTTKLFILSQSNLNQSSSTVNDSLMDTSGPELNQSKFETDSKNSDQLLQIIKILRKEKDLSVAKLDIVKAENVRLALEHTILQKKVDELNGFLNQERSKSESDVISITKHEEVLRKIETINALTDSNRILREERNGLSQRVKELNERISSIEEELFPLKKQNAELTSKIEEVSAENSTYRTEVIKWRQRANALVEKSNKNPEEFKRLQMERENLAKMLTSEKDNYRKISDELAAAKARLESEIPTLAKRVQALNEENKKLNEEIAGLKQTNVRMTNEIMELKHKLLQKEDEMQKANEELQSKDNQMVDLRNKELQIRKIAKRYKDSYTELANKNMTGENSMDIGGNVEDNGNNNTELENLRSQVENLNSTVSSTKEELENILKENQLLKDKISDDDSQTNLLREARAKVASLLEQKNSLVQELALQKTKSESQDSALKTTYEEKIARLEKELQDQIAINKEATTRITRENESLHLRINQLSRQLGIQQSAKPSTSSVTITEKGSISESSPRTANVKPMSGSATVQQSATVTPWRGSDTPLASIRPISVQNSRTAAILPTSQQPSAGSSSTTSSTSSASSSASGSTSGTGNTALVPPQQQVHTTGSSSLESMASSSPTSSHTDYMPSTSTAAVAVAAIPPMGTSSAAESSQEAESVQQPQQNDAQLYVSGGQPQVVALVSPRVEGSSSSTSTTSTQNTTSPNIQISQDSNNQQPSTSGSSNSSSTVVSSHSRHAPSSSNVTTTQAGCSSVSHKRPRDIDGDSTNAEESSPEKAPKMSKRLRAPMHSGEAMAAHIGDSGIDVDQMPTSSQRDQEDDIVVVDSEEDDGLAEADDEEGPIEGGEAEQEGYEDSYEQDQEMDDNECPEGLNESNMQVDASEQDNNEVDVDECNEQQAQCSSGTENQPSGTVPVTTAASSEPDNHQQSQAISSGSGETNPTNIPQSGAGPWKQASSSSNVVSSPHIDADIENKSEAAQERVSAGNFTAENYTEKNDQVEGTSEESKKSNEEAEAANSEEGADADEDFGEETGGTAETTETLDNESQQSSGATQSEIQDNQLSQIEGNSEENEGADGVTSEGEKQAIEGVEEEGREAEASTSASATINTRSKTSRGGSMPMRRGRNQQRGMGNRPTPIIWQEAPGNSRAMHNLRNQEQQQPGSPNRNFSPQRGQRGRRTMRRPSGGGNYSNMRYP